MLGSGRVAYDARMVECSGIGVHVRGVLAAIAELKGAGHAVRPFHFIGDTRKLQKYPYFAALGQTTEFNAPIYMLREQLMFPRIAGAAAYHFPHYNVPRFVKGRWFVTVHDLIHLLLPEVLNSRMKWFYSRSLFRHATGKALRVFTASQHAKSDIVRQLGVDPDRVVVIHNAVADSWQPVSEEHGITIRHELQLPQRYLLAVGVNKPHKNYPFLLHSFASWPGRRLHGMKLVLCGPAGSDLPALARELDIEDEVIFCRYLDHASLPAVYQGAEALVFPSLYEGFGIPPLEAQRVGTPVITSNAASMPEVCGDTALYFDPRSTSELHARLDELAGSDDLRDRLIATGKINEKRFRWSESARITLATYDSLLG